MADFKNYSNPWSAGSTPWYGDDSSRWLDYNAEGDVLHIPASFPARPSWATMLAAYPGPSVDTLELYENIGGYPGSMKTKAELKKAGYINSCAFRMSYGFMKAGYKLRSMQVKGQLVEKGDDGKYYWGRVMELFDEMKNVHLGQPDVTHTLTKAKLGESKVKLTATEMAKFTSKKGIIMFHVSGWGDASGHFTLWDGANLNYPGDPLHDDPSSEYYYFNMKYEALKNENSTELKVVQTDKIMLWEFK